MSGQFANKQFAGDQFAGKQFGANEGDAGIVWLTADLSGSGDIAATVSYTEESTRSGRRLPRLRAIREGYVCPAGVSSHAKLGVVRAFGRHELVVPGVARPLGVESISRVGSPSARAVFASAKATPGSLRPVRGWVGDPLVFGSARTAVEGVSAGAAVGDVAVFGCGAAAPAGTSALSWAGTPTGGGILNPSDEELVAMIVAMRRARLTSKSQGRILRKVSAHSLRQ